LVLDVPVILFGGETMLDYGLCFFFMKHIFIANTTKWIATIFPDVLLLNHKIKRYHIEYVLNQTLAKSYDRSIHLLR